MLGEGGALLGLRCRAGSRAERGERVHARFGTAMPLSVSRACTRGGRARAGEWPTGCVGGSQPLGIDDGGKGALVAWSQGRACLLRPGRHERALGGLGLRKRGRGDGLKQALAGGVLGLSWAVARRWLGVGGGWSEREGESEILARLPRAPPPFVSNRMGQRE
jgi:hypothetical protein